MTSFIAFTFRLGAIWCAVLLFSFAIVELKPGDPALAIAGQRASQAKLAEIRAEYGFDRSFLERTVYQLQRYTHFEFGTTLDGRPISDLLAATIPKTIRLSLFAAIVAVSLAFGLAVFSLRSIHLYSWLPRFSTGLLAMPIFVLGLFLLYIFYFYLELLPPGGYEDQPFDPSGPRQVGLLTSLWYSIPFLVLPGLTLGLKSFARLFFFFQTRLKEELTAHWYRALLARGLRAAHLNYYLFRRILPALAGILFVELGGLFAGAVVVEQIFFFPGLGLAIFEAMKNDDRVLLQVLILVSGSFFVFFNSIGKALAGGLDE